jgi:chorismate dehydratase
MSRVRLGAVGYLNARPHVYGLEHSNQFDIRFDVPSQCAALLHEGKVDVGLIPSIEYLRGGYSIVPDVAIASSGPVASVAIFTTRPIRDVRSIALDTSSRASVALARVLCAREFHIEPMLEFRGPDLDVMLADCDAALIIGDHALFLEPKKFTVHSRQSTGELSTVNSELSTIEKIDLGETWTRTTGLPFVYAFWAGRPDAAGDAEVRALQRARDAGIQHIDEIARAYFAGRPERVDAGARYLRDNIKYNLGPDEQAGLELFYRYAFEAGVVAETRPLQFY